MIDIHSHILWGLDDGPQQEAQSIAMAEAAVAEGIHTMIATPHHANGRYYNSIEVVEEKVSALNALLIQHHIPLDILSGQEIRVNNRLLDELDDVICQPLCSSRYILIELPADHVPNLLGDLIHELKLKQLIPIIAHPERNREIASRPELMTTFVAEGVLGQVTAASLNGRFGRAVRKVALELCQRQCIHFIASDAHNVTTRAFGLQAAYEVIGRHYGHEVIERYKQNAVQLINDGEVHRVEPIVRARRRFLVDFIKK